MSCPHGSSGSPHPRRPWRSWPRPSPRPPGRSRRRPSFSPLTAFAAAGVADRPAYPQQNVLPVWPDNPTDASAAIGDIPYDEIAPKLNALQAASNRVSARVAGKSSGGYDLYAVIVTAPETAAEAAQQERVEAADRGRPGPRARRTRTCSRATRRRCSSTATSTATRRKAPTRSCASSSSGRRAPTRPSSTLLQRNRIIFNVTSNPDGRVANTRANAAGYDLNRDLTIASQPEARLIRDLIVEHQADHHARPARLRQPDAAAPEHAAAQRQQRVRPLHQARRCRTRSTSSTGIAGLGYPEVTRARIPFRDDEPGVWDDFPPIYVPSFAMLQSSIPYTIEAPLQPGHRRRPRSRRADIDTDVHEVAIKTSLKYIQDHRNEVIFDQAEVYRRGWAGEPLRDIPVGYVAGLGPGGQVHHDVPALVRDPGRRAPALRAGRQAPRRPADRQRRPRDAGQGGLHRRRQLLPRRLLHPRPAPAQARPRQLAARAGHRPDRPRRRPLRRPGRLEPGAHVGRDRRHAVGRAARPSRPSASTAACPSASLPAGDTDLLLDPQDAEDLLALNALLEQGVKAQRLADGSVLIPRSARALRPGAGRPARRDVQGGAGSLERRVAGQGRRRLQRRLRGARHARSRSASRAAPSPRRR